MPSLHRIMLFGLLVVLPLSILTAQDEDEASEANATGAYVIDASEGNFQEADQDTLTLTLIGVPDLIQYVLTSNPFAAGQYSTVEFEGDWNFASEESLLALDAILSLEEINVHVTLSDPSYLDGVLSFEAEIEMIDILDPEENDDKAELPDAFQDATLYVPLYPEVAEALIAGRAARVNSARRNVFDPGQCPPSRFPNC